MNILEKLIINLRDIFAVFPNSTIVRPHFFKFKKRYVNNINKPKFKIISELNYDTFFFLMFGCIFHKISEYSRVKIDIIVTESISGSVGFNLKSFFQRNPFILLLKSNRWRRSYGKDLPTKITFRSSTWMLLFFDLKLIFTAYKLWNTFKSKSKQNYLLKYKNIEIGDLIIETYLRFRSSPKFNVRDIFVYKIIWQSVIDIERLSKFFITNKPDLYITSYTSYTKHGIPTRVALKYNIKTISFGNFQTIGKILTKKDNLQTHNCKFFKKNFDQLPNKNLLLNKAQKHLKSRLMGNKDNQTYYMKKSAYHEKFLNTNLKKSSVIIYLHDFFDAPHISRNFIFPDFWEWLMFTIKALNKYKINFYIKKHPNQVQLNESTIKKLRKIIPDTNWLPDKITTRELIKKKIILCGITVRGTISHELAYFGIPSICCAENPHISFDFCKTARSKREYKEFIKNYRQSSIGPIKMKRQSLAFYYMYNLYGSNEEVSFKKKLLDLLICSRASDSNKNLAKKTKRLLNKFYNDEFFSKICQNKFLNK